MERSTQEGERAIRPCKPTCKPVAFGDGGKLGEEKNGPRKESDEWYGRLREILDRGTLDKVVGGDASRIESSLGGEKGWCFLRRVFDNYNDRGQDSTMPKTETPAGKEESGAPLPKQVSTPSVGELAPGSSVRITGLQRKPEFNGAFGVVGGYIEEADRYCVRLRTYRPDGCSRSLAKLQVKRANLLAASEENMGVHCDHCCAQPAALRACARCNLRFYCGAECQKSAWHSLHKAECRALKALPSRREVHAAKIKDLEAHIQKAGPGWPQRALMLDYLRWAKEHPEIPVRSR